MSDFSRLARAGLVFAALSVILPGCALFRPAQVEWNDTKWCVPAPLKKTLKLVSRKFGPVRVHSTHRWPLENKLIGGKSKSWHLKCKAVDFSVEGDPEGVLAFLITRPEVGGYSRYESRRFYHIDTGPRRTW